MAESPAAPSVLKHLPVLDAPSPWIAQFLASADPGTHTSLFRSCKALRDMLLGCSSRVRLHHKLNKDPTGTATMASLQLLAGCKHGAQVKLVIDASEPMKDDEVLVSVEATLWLAHLCASMSLSSSLPLHHITCLDLRGIITDELVPPSVNAACPNLHHVKHGDYRPWTRISRLGAGPFPCPQVTRLTLDCDLPPPGNEAAELLKKQLQALPNLQDLTLISLYGERDDSLLGFWELGTAGLREQLIRLKMVSEQPARCATESPWPSLQCLYLSSIHVGSEELQAFSTNMPQLKSLSMHTMHEVEHCICAGDWLIMMFPNLQHVYIWDMNIRDLAMAPLRGLERFEFTYFTFDDDDMAFMPQALANITSCPYVGAHKKHIEVDTSCCTPPDQALPAFYSLFHELEYQELHVRSHFFLEQGSAALFKRLPQLLVLEIGYSSVAEDRLLPAVTALCVQAKWPATLRVSINHACVWGERWHMLLIEAMRAAGHQHITLGLSF